MRGSYTLFIGLEIHRLYNYKVMPVDLSICHSFLLFFLLLFLSFTLLELCPFDAVLHLKII